LEHNATVGLATMTLGVHALLVTVAHLDRIYDVHAIMLGHVWVQVPSWWQGWSQGAMWQYHRCIECSTGVQFTSSSSCRSFKNADAISHKS